MTSSRLAARVQRIKPSPSTSAADRANELRRQGQSIVNLVVGEPDFDTPAHIRQAAAAAMDKGATRYTLMAGTVELREAIVAKLQRENGLTYAMNEVIATSGAKSAIYNALAVTLEPGDEVLIPAPYWVSYPDMVLACDGVPVTLPCPESQGFKLTPAQLDAAITPKTRWLIVNSPSNPTGACYTAGDYRALAEVLMRHPQVMVMTDDIYEHIRYDDAERVHLLGVAPQLRDRTLAINGVSKTYAMTGWRIGYACGPAALIEAMMKVHQYSMLCASIIAQDAAIEALAHGEDEMKKMRDQYHRRRDFIVRRFNEIGLKCHLPRGSFYAFPDISKTGLPEKDFAIGLLQAEKVAIVPGSAFGENGKGFCRACFATSYEQLIEASNRIERHVQNLVK